MKHPTYMVLSIIKLGLYGSYGSHGGYKDMHMEMIYGVHIWGWQNKNVLA
jgi:hypothetical protein